MRQGRNRQSGDELPKDEHGIPQRAIDLRLSYRVQASSLEIVLVIRSRALEELAFDQALVCGIDFADAQEPLIR